MYLPLLLAGPRNLDPFSKAGCPAASPSFPGCPRLLSCWGRRGYLAGERTRIVRLCGGGRSGRSGFGQGCSAEAPPVPAQDQAAGRSAQLYGAVTGQVKAILGR